MNCTSHKLGFFSVVALITACQIDAGAFMLPANLASYGLLWIGGWALVTLGALALSFVFAQLGTWFPQTGGPYVFAREAFGSGVAFFTGWTYWVVSWVSTTVIVIASVGYLIPLIGVVSTPWVLGIEIALIVAVTVFNFAGVQVSGHVELALSVLKMIPLFFVPIVALFFFNGNNITIDAAVDSAVKSFSFPEILNNVALMIIWGFVGLESATVAAGSIDNQSKIIPRAIMFSTLLVAVIYLINGLGIVGLVPHDILMTTTAPYSDAVQILFGGNYDVLMSVLAAIICITSLNAWTLVSGQMSIGLAQSGILPACFARKNKYNAPIWGLTISCLGIILCLIFTLHERLATQLLAIIHFSVIGFLFVYVVCCLAFFKLLAQKHAGKKRLMYGVCGALALMVCCWILVQTSLQAILVACLFVLSGLPFYVHHRKK